MGCGWVEEKNNELFFCYCACLALYVALLWIALCVFLLARVERVNFMVLFAIVASGVVVFVPLYKKYVRNRKQ